MVGDEQAGQDRADRSGSWEREALERIALAAIEEQRRARRWRIFFQFVFALLVVFVVVSLHGPWSREAALGGAGPFTAVVDLDGTIEATGAASAHVVNAALRAAFRSHASGVILRADSPGGSPVQADEMYGEIMRLRRRYPHKPIYAVVGDLCASGCYYVVSATNKIYANQASLVGSIGVLMDGFGFVGTLKKLGVERRLMVAGKDKGFLDPFSPLTAAHRAFIEQMLQQIHQRFIARVEAGRGAALKKNDPRLFSGLAWAGERARQLGLIDGFGDSRYVARTVIGARRLVDFTPQPGFIDRFTHRFGADLGTALGRALTDQVLDAPPRLH